MTIYVLFYDYGADEGCSSPENVVLTAAEAEAWRKEDEYGQRSVSEFEVAESAIVNAS